MKRFITFILPGLLLVSGAVARADDDETDGSIALQANIAGHSAMALLSPADRTWSSAIPEITSDETCANLVGASGRAGSNSLTVTSASLGSQGCSVSGSY